MPVLTATRQHLPKLKDLNAGNVQQELAKANLGTTLSKEEARFVDQVFQKFGSDPGVKDALARLLQGVDTTKNGGAISSTVAALRGGATPVIPGQKKLPVALDLAHLGVKDANDLNPGKVKDFLKTHSDLTTDQLAKYVKKPGDAFRGVVEIDPKNMLPSPLGDILAGPIAVETHTNQYAVAPGEMGNRVLLNGPQNKELIAALEALRDTGILVKDMTHRGDGVWVAGPTNQELGLAFKGDRGVKGTTHRGTLDVGYDPHGKAVVVFTDWPVGYGHHLHGEYTPMVSRWSIDDMKFSGPPPSAAEKKSYYDTIRTYEALWAMAVKFTDDDTRQGFTNYKFSPMEDKKPLDLGERLDLSIKAFNPDSAISAPAQKELDARTFYCAEGVVACIHAGTMVPLNQNSVDRGLMKQETFDRLKEMEKVFQAAGGDKKGGAEAGWKALVAAKLIPQSMYDNLVQQRMQHRPFVLSDPSLVPLKDKGAETVNADGMLHKDQHIGGLAQGMMATAFPREKLAKGLAQRFAERAGQNPAVVAGVAQMLQMPADTPLPQLAGAFGWAVSAQFQGKMIESPEMQKTLKEAMGYKAMDPPSQAAVDNLIKKYTAVVSDPRLDRAALDAKLRELDDEAAKTPVNFPALNWQGLVTHVPPQGSRDALLGVDGHVWHGLRPAFDILDKALGS
jgi:hypothetical protein